MASAARSAHGSDVHGARPRRSVQQHAERQRRKSRRCQTFSRCLLDDRRHSGRPAGFVEQRGTWFGGTMTQRHTINRHDELRIPRGPRAPTLRMTHDERGRQRVRSCTIANNRPLNAGANVPICAALTKRPDRTNPLPRSRPRRHNGTFTPPRGLDRLQRRDQTSPHARRNGNAPLAAVRPPRSAALDRKPIQVPRRAALKRTARSRSHAQRGTPRRGESSSAGRPPSCAPIAGSGDFTRHRRTAMPDQRRHPHPSSLNKGLNSPRVERHAHDGFGDEQRQRSTPVSPGSRHRRHAVLRHGGTLKKTTARAS